MTVTTADLLIHDDNGVFLAILNRPAAINSLNHAMVSAMHAALIDWELDDDVHTVMVSGVGERGLCAGGDIVALYHSAKADGAEARNFWYDEYQLNARISRFPKPYVALMDGIVMGGGVGISAHGSIRIVTDTTKMAMPEVSIGFIPDAGGTYLLARTPGLLGLHVALTSSIKVSSAICRTRSVRRSTGGRGFPWPAGVINLDVRRVRWLRWLETGSEARNSGNCALGMPSGSPTTKSVYLQLNSASFWSWTVGHDPRHTFASEGVPRHRGSHGRAAYDENASPRT